MMDSVTDKVKEKTTEKSSEKSDREQRRSRQLKRPELLSPAGNYECFISAIKAGADAVYAGGPRFGARAYADNFTQDELLKAVDHVHLRDKKLYLTVNTVLKNTEMDELYDYIRPLYEQGLDGVIVQDIGVIRLLRECFPKLPLHASTQMAITGVEGVRLLEGLGISRVVPARELSLKELKTIHEVTGMELECFIHGALCYSYSGKCLFSSIAGGRSGNRGRCAGPCRLPYDGKYILSAKDICTLNILPELIEAGISSFKIEGRMKSKEYVAGVTGIYRKYIDKYTEESTEDYRVDKRDFDKLTGIYTRSGHCEGYYHEKNGREMITLDRPSYETADEEELKVLYLQYTDKDDRLQVNGILTAYKGTRLSLTLDCMGTVITCEGDIAEEAKNSPTDEGNIRKHLCKTGDSAFVFKELTIYAGDDVFVPVSSLNNLRRTALNALKDELLKQFRRNENRKINRKINGNDTDKYIRDNRSAGNKKDSVRRYYHCRIDSLEMLDAVCDYDFIDIISVDVSQFIRDDRKTDRGIFDRDAFTDCMNKVYKRQKRFYLALPPVVRNDYFGRNTELNEVINGLKPDGVIIDNYEGLCYLKMTGYKGDILSDVHMYALNNEAVQAMLDEGVTMLTCPVELNAKELDSLEIVSGEFIIYGRLPMMISAGCTEKTLGKCRYDNGISNITDRLGNVFPVKRNCSECYNTIYNCVPVMIPGDRIPHKPDINSYRIHFTVENRTQIKKVMDYYETVAKGNEAVMPDIKHTLGHFRRGVE